LKTIAFYQRHNDNINEQINFKNQHFLQAKSQRDHKQKKKKTKKAKQQKKKKKKKKKQQR
jgi:hypothetical protein